MIIRLVLWSIMDSRNFGDRDLDIDLENGTHDVIYEDEGSSDDNGSGPGQAKKAVNRVRRGFDGSSKGRDGAVDGPLENGEALTGRRLEEEENVGFLDGRSVERARKKGSRKPPKPPRPPRAPVLDAADRKFVREISEIATLKRARVERMKALKNMKNAKGSSTGSNLCALVITIIFCFIIIWQGLFSRGTSSVIFQGSPVSSLRYRRGLINVQLNQNFTRGPHGSNSASPRKHTTFRGSNVL